MTSSLVKVAALSFLLLILGGVSAYAANEAGAPDEKTRYEYAESLFKQGTYELAVTELTSFVKDYPKGEYTDDAYYWLGMHYMKTGRTVDGLDQFKIILALMPDGDKAPAAQFEIAYHWYDPSSKDRDLPQAMAEFLKIPFFYPDNALSDDAVYYAALCQAGMGRYEQAASELEAFMQKYTGSEFAPPAGYRLGLMYLLSGRTDEALASFQAVRDSHPAGLYADKALYAIRLVDRARDKTAPKEAFRQGGKGDAPGKLYKPSGVACGPDGSLYVADTGNSRVQRFVVSEDGLTLASSSVSPPTLDKQLMMDEPCAVAVGPRGRVYVADQGRDRVQVFDPEGGLLLSFGGKGEGTEVLSDPSGIAVDEGGSIYVAEKGNKRVSIFDAKGRFERSIGTGGDPDKALKSPSAVAVDIRGNLLVADDYSDRIYGYDSKGTLVMLYEKGKSGDGFELKEPSGIAVDGAGNVYVSDSGRGVVMMFDRDLRPVVEFPAKDKIDKPSGVAVSDSGTVFVPDYGENQVVVFK